MKCPKCGKEIEYLRYSARRQIFQEFSIVNGYPDYSDNDYGDDTEQDYYCPECSKSLFNNEDAAVEFLNS